MKQTFSMFPNYGQYNLNFLEDQILDQRFIINAKAKVVFNQWVHRWSWLSNLITLCLLFKNCKGYLLSYIILDVCSYR